MRLIRITTNYSTYLKQFYTKNPLLKKQPYAAQYQQLMADCFGWADFWTHALRKLGYEVWEPVGNAGQMQKAWAKEHGVHYTHKTWLTDVIVAQIKSFRPDILFVDDYSTYSEGFIRYVRQECSSIKLVLGWCGAPYQDETVFHAYDIVLSNIPELVEHFRALGHRAEHIHHAFAPRVLENMNYPNQSPINFSFIGSLIKGPDFHEQRELLVKKLVRETDLKVFSDVSPPGLLKIYRQQLIYDGTQLMKLFLPIKKFLAKIPKICRYAELQERPKVSPPLDKVIIKKASPPVFGLKMFQTLLNSKVTLNTHINISPYSASNMRMFEATGVGTCLLTDWKENLAQIFQPDQEVVTYRSTEECIEKLHWLLEHPEERKTIALAGQRRTLYEHTFDHRAIQLDTIIRKTLMQYFG